MKDLRNWFTMAFLLVFNTSIIYAQAFTSKVQQRKSNEGVVTIIQNKDVENVVNGAKITATTTTQPNISKEKKEVPSLEKNTPKNTSAPLKETNTKPQNPIISTVAKPDSSSKKETTQKEADKKRIEQENVDKDFDIPVIDTRKKVMKNSYKVNGYRVQVFAGGNSRVDRQKAEDIGNKLKQSFPSEPIYVHFYSPRWICRMGNYRTYEEANKILKQIQRMGYKQACLVQGKITIQY